MADGGGEPDSDRGLQIRPIALGDWNARAAQGTGVAPVQPLGDAPGMVEVGAGEPQGLGGEGEVLQADGAVRVGVGHLDGGKSGDGVGMGRRLPVGYVGLDKRHRGGRGGGYVLGRGDGVEAGLDELRDVAAGLGGVHRLDVLGLLEVVKVVGPLVFFGVEEHLMRRERRRRLQLGEGAGARLEEIAVAERAGGAPRHGMRECHGQRDGGLALVAEELR